MQPSAADRQLLAGTYDALSYGSFAIRLTHPSRLCAVARLLGLDPAPVETARVLEVGCAEGGNLLPMAASLPRARFVGIELSEGQVAIGKERARLAGIENVDWIQADLSEVADELGPFDYAVAHGLYSWVPDEVQEKLLALFGRTLAPHGVAYVSYNVYPGWHTRRMVREMLLYHLRGVEGEARRVAEARRFVTLLAGAEGIVDEPLRAILAEEGEWMLELSDGHFFHEVLEPDNRPCLFGDFVARVERNGLAYLGEARLAGMVPGRLNPSFDDVLSGLSPDRTDKEQYADFIRNRRFRQSLLCRAGLPLRTEPDPDVLPGLYLRSRLGSRRGAVDLAPGVAERFQGERDQNLETSDPVLKAALVAMAKAAPTALLPREIGRRAVAALGAAADEGAEARLADSLLRCVAAGLLEPVTWQPAFPPSVVERPRAWRWARTDARFSSTVASLWHEVGTLDRLVRAVLVRLDGTRDVAALAAEVAEAALAEGFVEDLGEEAVPDLATLRSRLEASLPEMLAGLARNALLEG